MSFAQVELIHLFFPSCKTWNLFTIYIDALDQSSSGSLNGWAGDNGRLY